MVRMCYLQHLETRVHGNPMIGIDSVIIIIIRLEGVIPVALELVGTISNPTIWNRNGIVCVLAYFAQYTYVLYIL